MGKIKDLTNQRFGKLLVLEITSERRNRQVVWKCQCDCGNITYVVGQALRNGHTKSCGCGNYDSRNVIDITGEVFGDLIVLERSIKKDASHSVFWKCKCSCGNIETILGTDLRNNKITKCSQCRKNEFLLNPSCDHTGEKFGLLTVIAPTKKRSAGNVIWKCQCDCGTICEISSNALVSGNTNSCGCLRNSSLGESLIEQYLKMGHISYKKQITFADCRSPKNAVLLFDFGLYDQNNNLIAVIEYDGIQHFTPIEYFGGEEAFKYLQSCDNIKNKYMKEQGIPLFRISYLQKNEISNILENVIKNYYEKL